MSEADRLLHSILEGGDIVGRDAAGRMVIVLAIEPRDFEQLLTFGAVEVESECGGDDEPYEVHADVAVLVLGSRPRYGAHGPPATLGACTGAWCATICEMDREYWTT